MAQKGKEACGKSLMTWVWSPKSCCHGTHLLYTYITDINIIINKLVIVKLTINASHHKWHNMFLGEYQACGEPSHNCCWITLGLLTTLYGMRDWALPKSQAESFRYCVAKHFSYTFWGSLCRQISKEAESWHRIFPQESDDPFYTRILWPV